jgi:hypothetical protein
MQWANQRKSTGPSSPGEANFDCKYPNHVSLINLVLFIFFFLKEKKSGIGIPLHILWLAYDLQHNFSKMILTIFSTTKYCLTGLTT